MHKMSVFMSLGNHLMTSRKSRFWFIRSVWVPDSALLINSQVILVHALSSKVWEQSSPDLTAWGWPLWLYFCVAAAKSLQLCPTLCDPIDGSPPGSAIPGILQVRTLERVAISFSNVWKGKVKVKSLSCVWLFATSWTAAYQAPPSMGFSRPRVLEWVATVFLCGCQHLGFIEVDQGFSTLATC